MSNDNNNQSALLRFAERARADFEMALRKGFWRSFWSWFTQSDNKLLPFDEIRKILPIHGQHSLGMQQIPLDHIVGSVGRYQDFDRAFLPRFAFLRPRWVSIDSAQLQDIILPPVDIYKIGEVYFVKDGNHRVSVARQRGQVFIDANVTEITTPISITPQTNIDELIRQSEKMDFFEKTSLDQLRLGVQIEFTLPGGYSYLLEHIEVHRWFMGEARHAPVPYSEAVTSWYEDIYLPMVEVIECDHILKNFPNRTEADLYIWIIEHLWYLREEYQHNISMQEAAEHYAKEYSEQPFRWLMALVNWATQRLAGGEGGHKEGKD